MPLSRLLLVPILSIALYFLYRKWQASRPKSLYNYTRQPWVDHILSYLDEGSFYEAEELCEEKIKSYPQIDEYKLLQVKILVAAGNLSRAQTYLHEYLEDELAPAYRQLFNLYTAYLLALESQDICAARKILLENKTPPKASYAGLHHLWQYYLNSDSDIVDNFTAYPQATKIERAERNFLAGLTLLKSQPILAQQLLTETISLAPKSYFARRAGEILKNF